MFCLQTFCPYGRFLYVCLWTFCPSRRFCPPRCLVPMEIWALLTFGASWIFELPDVLSCRTFCPSGCFVPHDVMSHGCYVSALWLLCLRTLCLQTLSLKFFQPNGVGHQGFKNNLNVSCKGLYYGVKPSPAPVRNGPFPFFFFCSFFLHVFSFSLSLFVFSPKIHSGGYSPRGGGFACIME
jgi:hypothetical protein